MLSLCTKGYLQAAVSTYVLTEATRNIQARMKVGAWSNYQVLLATVPFIMAPVPTPLPTLPPVNAKDVHVAAAAMAVKAAYLLTMDKGLMTEAKQAQVFFFPLTPGDFIKTVLPTHVEYPVFP